MSIGWICFKCMRTAPKSVVDPACPGCGGRMKRIRSGRGTADG